MMEKIKNIIFDYGNVIFEIDFKRTQTALLQIGITNVEDFFAHKNHHKIFDDFEKGAITKAQFRDEIRATAQNITLKDDQIDHVWNSLLIGIPKNNHEVLLDVKQKYRTFLLSNNNEIHYDWIINYIQQNFKLNNYDNYFERTYFSQHTAMRKPDVAIFNMVIAENKLVPEETLFIDDSPQHIEGAKKAGLQTLLMDVHPSKLKDFLTNHHLL